MKKPRTDGSWTEKVLHGFCSASDCTDGAGPWAGLTFDASGNLYGTTRGYGGGTVFEITP
ncbi:MAG TPA: hypothetical protein VN777_15495 [Terriglobales bacterium]|nr:hypothetical protein [Terriglobales bacterium]